MALLFVHQMKFVCTWSSEYIESIGIVKAVVVVGKHPELILASILLLMMLPVGMS